MRTYQYIDEYISLKTDHLIMLVGNNDEMYIRNERTLDKPYQAVTIQPWLKSMVNIIEQKDADIRRLEQEIEALRKKTKVCIYYVQIMYRLYQFIMYHASIHMLRDL